MAKFLVRTLTATIAVASVMAIAPATPADEPPTSESAYVPYAMDEIFFSNGGSYNKNRSISGQLGTMFGVGSFPEEAVMEDAYAIFEAYQYLLEQQTRTDPTLRVPDLANPYSTSVQFLPAAADGAVSGSEFIFE